MNKFPDWLLGTIIDEMLTKVTKKLTKPEKVAKIDNHHF